jgi:signal peptidase I
MNSELQSDAHAVRCDLAQEILRSSGRLHLQVTGWSMLPTVWPGDTLLIDHSDAHHVSEGDIVLFERGRRFFVHRIVKKNVEGSQILTRGDAMSQPDPPFAERELLGKVSQILRHGDGNGNSVCKCTVPRQRLRLPELIVSALVQRSVLAARAIVGLREWFRRPRQISLNPN